MVHTQISTPQMVYFQDTTTNKSFMDMHYLLKAKGIKNNKFFLVIYDPGLMGVDPRDPQLPFEMKKRVLRECQINFWYFIREVVRIPTEGGEVGGGKRYKLHRGNLAMNYLFIMNYDMFVDLPRQHFKTFSALCWYLWVFNFGTSNTKMMFINKKHEDSKKNLKDIKTIRESLPSYLQMDAAFDINGKKIRVPNTAETLQHPINHNIIKTLPAARTKAMADGAGRGATMAIQYYDEFAFMPYNEIIYAAASPAFSRAKQNAKENRVPYGILITTTPGDLTTDEGIYANKVRLNATPWLDSYYDLTYQQLENLKDSNNNSTFFYIRYTYKQLGSGEDYFVDMVKQMGKDWAKIRREVLIEWDAGSMNCPFSQENLDIIKSYCRTEPITTVRLGKYGQYTLNIWSQMPLNSQYPPIIGVDVAGGYQQDSSAITIIDSQTTKVIATLNCNYIPSQDLAQCIFDIVTTYCKNAIVNVERNGGFGASVLSLLVKSKIKKNLYFEIKDRVIQERYDGIKTVYKKTKVKSYGTDNTKDIRNKLIELLHARVNYHKDKFLAPILHDELSTMEVKKNGKTEHAANAHDDQVFSYLMALYVWYYGENLAEHFHIIKTEINTDEDNPDYEFSLDERYGGLEIANVDVADTEYSEIVESQQKILDSSKTKSIEELRMEQFLKDQEALDNILSSPDGRKAYSKSYNIDLDYLEKQYQGQQTKDITGDILSSYYDDNIELDMDGNIKKRKSDNYAGNLSGLFRNIK